MITKRFYGIMTQTSTGNPVVEELVNEIGSITWTRTATGTYFANSNGKFKNDSTWRTFLTEPCLDANTQESEWELRIGQVDEDQIQFTNLDYEGLTVDGVHKAYIKFEVILTL
jgi:hypothetical protein